MMKPLRKDVQTLIIVMLRFKQKIKSGVNITLVFSKKSSIYLT